jgi:hypothetical protein
MWGNMFDGIIITYRIPRTAFDRSVESLYDSNAKKVVIYDSSSQVVIYDSSSNLFATYQGSGTAILTIHKGKVYG